MVSFFVYYEKKVCVLVVLEYFFFFIVKSVYEFIFCYVYVYKVGIFKFFIIIFWKVVKIMCLVFFFVLKYVFVKEIEFFEFIYIDWCVVWICVNKFIIFYVNVGWFCRKVFDYWCILLFWKNFFLYFVYKKL